MVGPQSTDIRQVPYKHPSQEGPLLHLMKGGSVLDGWTICAALYRF